MSPRVTEPLPRAPGPPLSVVIPTRDTVGVTTRCVEALLGSAVDGMEVIVVDDASSDSTGETVRSRFPGVEVVALPTLHGYSRACNLGAARSAAPVVLFLNSDTEVISGLPDLVRAFRDEPRLGVAGARLRYPDGRPQWSGGPEPSLLWLFVLASGIPGALQRLGLRSARTGAKTTRRSRIDWVSGAALAVRREAWAHAGGFDEGFQFYAQDLDLCLRLRRAGWQIALRPDFEVIHHQGLTISRDASGTVEGQELALLWTDMTRWARRWRGEPWARRARASLRAGGRLRLLGVAAARALVPGPRRPYFRDRRAAVARALHALRDA